MFTISSLENSGGSERSLTSRVNYLVENFSYEITIVTTAKDCTNSYYYVHNQVNIVNIPLSYSRNSFWDKVKVIFYNSHFEERVLSDYITKNGFDICSSLGSETFLYKPKKFSSFVKIKEHRFTYKRFFSGGKLTIFRLIWRFIRLKSSIRVLKKMDYVVTLTDEDAKFWSKYHSRIQVMPNFIDISSICDSSLNSNAVIAVGRLEKEKDFASLIRIFDIVVNHRPEWILEIYGEGSLKSQLEDLIYSLNLEKNIYLKGSVANIFRKYEDSSIYVHTAAYEGFGNSILEAMAHSLPVVAFKSVGGVKVLVKDSFNGYMIQNRDITDFATKVIQLIDDFELRKTMGNNSKKIAYNFGEDEIMLKWHKFYSSI